MCVCVCVCVWYVFTMLLPVVSSVIVGAVGRCLIETFVSHLFDGCNCECKTCKTTKQDVMKTVSKFLTLV